MLPSPVHDLFEFLNKARRLEWGSFFVSPVDAPVASVPCVANAVLPPQDGFCALAQRSTLARLLYSVTCVLIPAHSLDTAAVRWALIWSRVISPTVFFFAKNGFSTFRAYSFPNFRIRCLSTKNKKNLASSDFDRDYIKPTNRFGENWQLYCVWPPLHEHCVPLHLFRSSSFYQHFVIISMRILHVSLNVCLDISFSLDFPHSLKAPIYQTDFIC